MFIVTLIIIIYNFDHIHASYIDLSLQVHLEIRGDY